MSMNKHEAIVWLSTKPVGTSLFCDHMHNNDKLNKMTVCEIPNYDGGIMTSILGFYYSSCVPTSELPEQGWYL